MTVGGRGVTPRVPPVRPWEWDLFGGEEIPRPAGGWSDERRWKCGRRVDLKPDARNVGQVAVSAWGHGSEPAPLGPVILARDVMADVA